MRADVQLRGAAYLAAPLALVAGWRAARSVARREGATIMHGHWVIPGGVTAAMAAPRLPLVVSLHGSDVYVAETLAPARVAARRVFQRAGFVTACSDDLARRAVALGASPSRLETIPYGVDTDRFRPDASTRMTERRAMGVPDDVTLAVTAGRLVRKKGFEYLIDAVANTPRIHAAIAGDGSLAAELKARAAERGVTDRILFLGNRTQDEVARLLMAGDIAVVPSVRDDSGNVDGLPNVVMDALASGTPLVATPAGGIGSVVEDGRTALVVPERDAAGLSGALVRLRDDPALGARIGRAAREHVAARFGWGRVAERLEHAYDRALAFKSHRS
jgi:glycosyltransferase involved in cell wall biosynthesis